MKKLTAIISLIALAFIMTLASCAPISDNVGGNSSQITIRLPPIASNAIRALDSVQVSRLQRDTKKYRVTFSGVGQTITREGEGTTYSATFPVGVQVGVTVYCLNAKGEVIVKTVTKNITISSGANSLSFKLSEDGTEIEVDKEDPPPNPNPEPKPEDTDKEPEEEEDGDDTPSGDNPPEQPPAPQPVPNKVKYDYGEAKNDGNPTGLPEDTNIYKVGDVFTVKDGSGMSWIHAEPTNSSANGFLGWTANPAIETEGGAQATDAPTVGQKYKMPDGGVVLTAEWNKKQYSITYELNLPSDTGQTATLKQSPNNQTDITALSSVNIYDAKLEITNNPIGSKNYTFVRWNGDDGKEYAPNEEIKMLTGDLELTAEWTDKNVYTVTYVSNDKDSGSSVPAAQSHEEGENANIDFTAPARTGYDFVGWNEGSSDTISDTAAYMSGGGGTAQITGINRNYTLYAVWKAKTYKVIYEPNPPNGATVTLNGAAATRQERDRTYGQSFSWESNMFTAPAGYRYGGWNTQSDGQGTLLTGTPSSTYTGQANDITVYAVWTPELENLAIKTSTTAWAVGDIVLQNTTNGDIVAIEPSKYDTRDKDIYSDGVAVVYKHWNSTVYIVGTQINPGVAWCNGYPVEGFADDTKIAELKTKKRWEYI